MQIPGKLCKKGLMVVQGGKDGKAVCQQKDLWVIINKTGLKPVPFSDVEESFSINLCGNYKCVLISSTGKPAENRLQES